MCESKNKEALRNGHAGDPVTQGHALADLLDAVGGIEKSLREIPTRTEVREMIHEAMRIHVETCDAARDGKPLPPPEKNKFSLGKGGITAEGRAGVILGAVVGIVTCALVFKVAPYIGVWLGALASKGG